MLSPRCLRDDLYKFRLHPTKRGACIGLWYDYMTASPLTTDGPHISQSKLFVYAIQ